MVDADQSQRGYHAPVTAMGDNTSQRKLALPGMQLIIAMLLTIQYSDDALGLNQWFIDE
jgi:hypothetical protein